MTMIDPQDHAATVAPAVKAERERCGAIVRSLANRFDCDRLHNVASVVRQAAAKIADYPGAPDTRPIADVEATLRASWEANGFARRSTPTEIAELDTRLNEAFDHKAGRDVIRAVLADLPPLPERMALMGWHEADRCAA